MWGWWIIKSLHVALGPWPTVTVALALSLILAWLIHRMVERRFAGRLKKAVLRSLSPEQPAAAAAQPGPAAVHPFPAAADHPVGQFSSSPAPIAEPLGEGLGEPVR